MQLLRLQLRSIRRYIEAFQSVAPCTRPQLPAAPSLHRPTFRCGSSNGNSRDAALEGCQQNFAADGSVPEFNEGLCLLAPTKDHASQKNLVKARPTV